MSKITIECFDNSAEICAYERTDSPFIEYLFKPSCEGFVNISGESYKVRDGVCVIDAARLWDREIFPMLVLGNQKVALPPMINEENEYKIKEYDDDFIRKLSLGYLRQAKRLSELEKKMEELSKKVYRTTIF